MMKVVQYAEVEATYFNNDKAKDVAARVVLGKADGADNFCMRVFEISGGGNTPKHSHDWEHEMFIHHGEGEVYGNSRWNRVKAGNVLFIPCNEEHQIRNSGKDTLIVVCLVPAKAPEL
jgi:quercetin dioxygenase-like cupin family protein